MNGAELQVIVLAAEAGAALPQMLGRATAVAGHAVTVVLGARARELAPALGRLPVALVVDRNWEEGAAAPIRAGLHSLPGSCGGALLLHGAQSGVTSADLQRLIDAWRRNPRAIVAAQCGGGYNLPAIFPRREFPSLLRLRGGQDARSLLRAPNAAVIGVPMPGAVQARGPDAVPVIGPAPAPPSAP